MLPGTLLHDNPNSAGSAICLGISHCSGVLYYLQRVRHLLNSQRGSAAIGGKAGGALLQRGHLASDCPQRCVGCRRQIVARKP